MTGRMTMSAVNLPWFYWVIVTHRHKCMRFATETSLVDAAMPVARVATIGLQFGIGAVIGIGVAIGVPARGGRLALLLARKTAVAAAGTEIASLDAEWEFPRRGGQRTRSRAGTAQYRRPKHLSHGVLRSLRAISPAREQTGPGGRPQFTSRVRCAAEFQGTARSVRRVR